MLHKLNHDSIDKLIAERSIIVCLAGCSFDWQPGVLNINHDELQNRAQCDNIITVNIELLLMKIIKHLVLICFLYFSQFSTRVNNC